MANVLITKIGMPLDKMAEAEYAASQAERSTAIQDYNIMMGNLEDPGEGEDEMEGAEL